MESPLEQSHLLFGLGAYTLALPLATVRSVERPGRFTAIPFAAPWLRGVTAVAGAVVSAVDLGQFAGVAPAGTSPGARLLVVQRGNVTAGLLVDRVSGLASIPDKLSPPPVNTGPLAAYWGGAHTVEGEVVLVLDADRLFQSAAFHTYQVTPAPDLAASAPSASHLE